MPLCLRLPRLCLLLALAFAASATAGPIVYPETKKGDVADDLHGTKVPDPYRWLEDADAADTKAWVEAQNRVTFGFLEQIPARNQIKERMTQLWNYEKFGAPFKVADRYFITHNTGLQNQYVWYTTTSLDGEMKELLDVNPLSAEGTVSVNGADITDDGKLLAYGLSGGGSDMIEIKVRDVATGKDLPDQIKWVKFSGPSWTKDGKGFFYSRYDEPKGNELTSVNYFHKLCYHKLGTPQSEDVLICDNPQEKTWGFSGQVTDDGQYLASHFHDDRIRIAVGHHPRQ